jgi:CubicO group peptidase (beta-lactamase class C family)
MADSGCSITRTSQNRPISPSGSSTASATRSSRAPIPTPSSAALRLSGLKPGAYRLAATKVGYRANDVQSAWRDLGSPSQLTRAQVGALKRASSGEPILIENAEIGAAGAFGTAAWIDPIKGAIYVMMVQRPNMPDNFENPPALAFVRAAAAALANPAP